MASFGPKIRLPTNTAELFAGVVKGWWSRGENRVVPDYQSEFNELAGLWLSPV